MPLHIRIRRTFRAVGHAWRGDIAWSKVWFVARTGAPAIVANGGGMYFTDKGLETIYFGPATTEALTFGYH
ncbi:MAG: hypothetical protein EPN36_14455 [Rhodanobacteraceae bacterium]|nr:MAG: hypothetical protein EPN36_14455 [Rhodanobacteraceae bacterium]